MSTETANLSYVTFCKSLVAAAQKQGLKPITADTVSGLPENDGWCFLRFSPDGAALIIPKGKTRLGNLHSHVDLSGKDGYVPLGSKKIGKVICFFEPNVEKVSAVLSAFVGAAKRPTAAPVSKAASQAPVQAPQGDVFGEALDQMLNDSGAAQFYASEEEDESEMERLTAPQS